MTLENSTKPPGTTSGPVRTRRVSLPHNAKPYERKRPVNKKKKPNNEDEPEGLLSMLKTVITKPLGWIYRGTQQQPTTTSTTTTKEQNSTGNVQGTINENGFSAPETESQSNFQKEKSPTTTPRRKPSTQSLYAPKPAVAGSRKTLTLATSIQHPTHSPIQPKTDHELMIERVAAIPTPIRLKQANPPSAESTDSMECEESVPSVPINDFNARMSAFFQSKGNAPLTDEERQLILESVGQPSRFPPEAQGHLRPQQYMSSEIPNSSSYANQSPFVTRKRAFPVSPPSNALSYHMPYHQPSYPPSDFLRPTASSSRDYGRHVVESVPGSADRFGGSRMDVDRRYDLHERPGKRRDVRSNEERRRLQAMNEYAGNQDNFNAATAERIIQSLQRDNRTPLLDARRAPSSMYSRKGLIDPRTRRGQREMYPMEELPPSRPLATPILPPSRPTRTTGPYTKDRRAVKQRAAALAAARKETDEDAAVSYFSSSASASAAAPVAAPKATPKKKASATAAQMLAGIPMKGKGDDRLLKSISRTEDEDMDVDSGAGQKKNAAREIAISGEASRAFLTKPPSGLTDSVSTTEPLFNFTKKSQPTVSMTPTPLAAALKPKEVDADAMDEGDEDGKKQQGFSKRISLKARPAPRIPPKREKRGFSAEEDVEADEETIARENALKEIPALPIGNIAFAMKPSEPGVFKVPGLPASASNKPTENFDAAFTPFKTTTSTDSSVVPAPVTPATFAKLSPSKTTSPFATLTAATTTPAGPPPKSVYSGPAPQIDFANATTSNGTDISATVTAKPDTAPPVAPSTFGIVTPAVTSEPSTESAISTTPFGTPSKTSASLFGATSASAAPPALPVFSFPPTSTTTVVTTTEAAPASVISTSKENAVPPAIFGFGKPATAAPVAPSMFGFGVPAVTSQPTTVSTTPFGAATEPKTSTSLFGATNATAAPPAFSFPATSSTTAVTTSAAAPALVIGTSKENAGPPAIFGFGKPADTSKPEVSAPTSTVVPSITPEVKATPTPAPVSFNFGTNFGTPVKAASTPEESTEMQMSPAQTPTSGSNVGAPPPISFDPPPSSGAFIFGGTSQATAPVTATTASGGFTGFAFTKPAATTTPASSGSGFTFGNTAAPSFNFGGGVTTPATGISFAGAAKTEEAAKPFAFGSGTPSTSTTTGAPSTGGFSFGANTTGFGTSSSTTATTPAASTPFSFGQMTNGVNPSPAVGGNSGFTFGAPPTTGSAGFAFGGASSSNAATTFSFGGTPTPATPQQSSGPPSFQFGTGVPNGNNPTGEFSFQSQQQQPVNSGAAQQPFGFAFGGPQASTPAMAPASNPIQGGMTPFAFGAPSSAPTGGESLFSMGSITSGAKSGRAIARPRSKKR